jgi:hypothetical protein
VSANKLTFDGLSELRDALRRLPDELKVEAQHIVAVAANGAAAEIRQKYPARTGNLVNGVSVRPSEVSHFGAGAIVVNRAKHAFIFENGTQARHYFTKSGAKHEVGRMPPGHVFVPIVIRKRRQMYDDLKGVLVRNGLQVSGDAE